MPTIEKVLQRKVTCPECKGKGIWEENMGFVSGPCGECHGAKFILVDVDMATNRKCVFCNFESKSPSGLKQHMLRKHGELMAVYETPTPETVEEYTCPICSVSFETEIELNNHLEQEHGFDVN